jgi:hypothetical protein
MPETELTKLRHQRSRAQIQLRKLEPRVASYQAQLTQIDARILELVSQLDPPTKRRTAIPVFAFGELPRIVTDILRAEGKALPVAVIAAQALARKGVTLPGPGLMKGTRAQVRDYLLAMERRGVVFKVDSGKATRRGLAPDSISPPNDDGGQSH